ncbi:MAG: hypothetical protein AB1374_02915 [Bacillota bacterium]
MPRYREEVIIPLSKGCIAILTTQEAAWLLSRCPELYDRAVRRGKRYRRHEKDYHRQAKPGTRDNGPPCWTGLT